MEQTLKRGTEWVKRNPWLLFWLILSFFFLFFFISRWILCKLCYFCRFMRAVPWTLPVRSQRDCPACSPCWTWVLVWMQGINMVSLRWPTLIVKFPFIPLFSHSERWLLWCCLQRKNTFAPCLGEQRWDHRAQHGEHPAATWERYWL